MKWILAIVLSGVLSAVPALAAISGTIVNGTTGQPQAGIAVTLLRMGQAGPEPAGDGKADAQGKFSLNAEVSSQGPTLLRATLDGVTYTKVIPPGTPSEGLTLNVYNSSKQPGPAKVSKHMILFEPTAQGLTVNETFLFENDGKTTWNDPADGTLRLFLPAGAEGKVRVGATAPGGMPLQESAVKTSKPDVYKVNFPIRPGQTRFDTTYTTPYTEGQPLAGKIVTPEDNTYLVVPKGISLVGDNINDMGVEPRTEAHIFGLKDSAYKVTLTGVVVPASSEGDANADSANQDGAPQIQEIMPRLYTQVTPIMGLALGILALGFILLYRTKPGETNERSRG